MAENSNNYYWLSQKLFLYDRNYNNFTNLDSTRMQKLIPIINNYKNRGSNSKPISLIDNYFMILSYLLNNSTIKATFTYDEKIFVLIEILDPDLNIFKEYLTATPYKTINDKKVTERRIREKFGFFEPYIIKYESQIYRNIKPPTKFLSHIAIDFTSELLKYAQLVRSFSDLTDDEVNEIKNKAFIFASETDDNSKETISFNAYYSNNLLNINSIKERIAFFITIFDPDLNILKIYEEESQLEKTKERIINEIGFFNNELIRLEKIYHERFCPDKKVSIWTL